MRWNVMPLTEKQNETIDLLIIGNLSKVQIAKSVGIAEKSIYNWLNNNQEFKAELQRRTEVFNDTRMVDAKNKLSIHLDMAINNIVEMAQDKDNPKRFECNKYIIDRNLGNTTTKVETKNTDNENDKNVDINALLNEIDEDSKVLDT
jgi:predicted DNA-binding protein YlxM (UPF0122 family)